MTAPTAVKRPPTRPSTPAAPTRAAGKVAPAAAPAATKKAKKPWADLACLCGCGQATKTPEAKFIPGHDAKLKSLLLKIERGEDGLKVANIPAIAKPFLQKSTMSGAWSFPTESGNTPDEDKYGVQYSERKAQVEADREAKKVANQQRLAKLKADAAKKVPAKKAPPKGNPAADAEEIEE